MDLDQFFKVFCLLLYGLLLARVLLYIFSPLYNFSGVIKKNLLDYMGALFYSVLSRFALVTVLGALSSCLLIVAFLIDYSLFILFDYSVSLNSHQLYIIILWLLIIATITRTSLREKGLVDNGIYELVSHDELRKLGSSFPWNYGDSLKENLEGVCLYKCTTSDLIAYTYGGFLLRPRIVVSSQMLSESWAPCLRSVLLHEINHIEREDTFYLLLTNSLEMIIFPFMNALLKFSILIERIPIVKYLNIIIKSIISLWDFLQKFTTFINRQSEFFADTETFSKNPPDYLVLALHNLTSGHLMHTAFLKIESIAHDLVHKEVFITGYRPETFKDVVASLIHLGSHQSTHPENKERYYWAAVMSERMRSRTGEEKEYVSFDSRYTAMTILALVILPFLYLGYHEINKAMNYDFKEQDVLNYKKYLLGSDNVK